MPSLTKGLSLGVPKIRSLLVSFSVNSSGTSPSQYRYHSPRSACVTATTCTPFGPETCFNDGLAVPGHQVQMLRNQTVGNTSILAASGPRLLTLIWISRSSGDCLAYSTKTSK